MRFVYATDLHGDTFKYNEILAYAISNRIGVIHIGADLLPKGSGMSSLQKRFVGGFLREWHASALKEGIKVLGFWGNDDLWHYKKDFKKYNTLLDETPQTIEDFSFHAYGYVPDYPFGLKDSCKLDSDSFVRPQQISKPYTCLSGSFDLIKDTEGYFKEKGTIEKDLIFMDSGSDTVMAFHCPPAFSDLDKCIDGRTVGSVAVYDWLCNNKVKLCLCGHIHESPESSGKWFNHIGPNLVIQPGDRMFVDIKIDFFKSTEFLIIKYKK